MQALFLHVVSESYYSIEMPEDKFINGIPVLFFRTYVGAATKAYKNGLISRAGLQRVVALAAEDLHQVSIPQKSSKWSSTSVRCGKSDATSVKGSIKSLNRSSKLIGSQDDM